MKTNMLKITALLVIIAGCVFACNKLKPQPVEGTTNVSFTPCKQSGTLKGGELSGKVNVEFTNKGVQITHHDFEVSCDFTTVKVTHTFVNGVLRITQKGTPNQADCVCHTDVSYTIDGISQDEVNVIFINGVQVYCYNENNILLPCHCIIDTLKGEWIWIKKYSL